MRLGILAGGAVMALSLTVGTSLAAEPPKQIPKSATGTLELPAAPAPPAGKTVLPPTLLPVRPSEVLPAEPSPNAAPLEWLGPNEITTSPAAVHHPSNYTWARAEYLFWHLSGGQVPPLVTTGQGTLFGNDNPIDNARSGGRLTLGTWIDSTRALGVEASAFMLGRSDESISAFSPDGSATLFSSPFFDPSTGLPNAITISSPGIAAGSTQVSLAGRSFVGAEALVRGLLSSGPEWRLDALVGYRYRRYTEALDIRNAVSPLGPPLPAGTLIASTDEFRAENDFSGALLGIDYQKDWGNWTLTIRPSVGIGIMDNSVLRSGYSIIDLPGQPRLTYPGGVYNLSSNIGEVHGKDWTVIPELDARVSKQVWSFLRVTVGYTAMYLPTLVRVGEQIDPVVNSNFLPPVVVPTPGPIRPAPVLERGPAWLQGLTVGLEMRF